MIFMICALGTAPAWSYELPDPKAMTDSNLRELQKISTGVSELADKASNAVVFISVKKILKGQPRGAIDPFDFFFGPQFPHPNQRQRERQQAGLGSGFLVDIDKGYIITNNHVIEGADEISLKLANGSTYTGKVLGTDKNTDVAVVQITDKGYNKKGLGELTLVKSDKVSVGSFVLALGAPFGLETSLSFGVVSAVGRGSLSITSLGDFIQTDAAINPGNSGGPLINMKGQVIGMNTAIYSRTGSSAGIGFAVPAHLIRKIASQLINNGKVARGYLGVQLTQEMDEDMASSFGLPKDIKGALIARVERGTPADKAKLQDGDFIVNVDGRTIDSNEKLTNTIGLIAPGTEVTVKFYRNGKLKETKLKLGEFPSNIRLSRNQESTKDFKDTAGMELEQLSSSKHKDYIEKFNIESKAGLLVVNLAPDSPAADAGIRPGDVIIRANRIRIKDIATFEKIYSKNRKTLVQIERGGSYRFAPITK